MNQHFLLRSRSLWHHQNRTRKKGPKGRRFPARELELRQAVV